jgi:uncharacterized protein YkvS
MTCDNSNSLTGETQFLYLHRYLYGGATTFAAHLLHKVAAFKKNNIVLRVGKKYESKLREFGYDLYYRNISFTALKNIKYPFIVLFKDNFIQVLDLLNEGKGISSNTIMVIHDHRDISDKSVSQVKNYKLITIRKTVQEYLKNKYDLDSTFMYHPFYSYPIISKESRKGAISISRISFEKNTDIIINANKILENLAIRLYGCPSRMYVHLYLGGLKGDFKKYYCGKFDKSFEALTGLLSESKFVVDLSVLTHDGGGTQYTFLEAIHNGCALILHRRWLENSDLRPYYCDFREGYNCLAVENEKELVELIKNDPDTTKIVANANKLMSRHINVDWSYLLRHN